VKSSEKQNLRNELRQRIRDAGPLCSDGVVRKIADHLNADGTIQTIAVYAALPGEVSLAGLGSLLGQKDCVKWVFPKVVGERLKFFQIRDPDIDMERGAFGIMEPKDGLEEVGIAQIDVFLCPGLGFDTRGGRVGRGKGFYDRMLSGARPDAIKLGVCFTLQLVDQVVMEPHDIRMDHVISG